jgi:hypothetical protein
MGMAGHEGACGQAVVSVTMPPDAPAFPCSEGSNPSVTAIFSQCFQPVASLHGRLLDRIALTLAASAPLSAPSIHRP